MNMIDKLNHVSTHGTPADFIKVLNEILQANNKPLLEPDPLFESVVKAIKDLGLEVQFTIRK